MAIVIELSWTKVIVIVIDTLSNCNYSIAFPITSENANSPNERKGPCICPITVKVRTCRCTVVKANWPNPF